MNKWEFCLYKNNEQGEIEEGGLNFILVMINRLFFFRKFKIYCLYCVILIIKLIFFFYKVVIEVDVLRFFNCFKYNYEIVDIWLWFVGEKFIKVFKWGFLLSIEFFFVNCL